MEVLQKSKDHLSLLIKYKSLAEYISICLIFIYSVLCFFHATHILASTRIVLKYEGWLICNLVLNVCLLFGLKYNDCKILFLWLFGNIGEFIIYVGIASSTIDWWEYFADSFLLGLYMWAIWVILTVMQLIRLESKLKKSINN